MMVARFTIVDFWRWIAGGGSLFSPSSSSSSSSSKSKLTVLSAFLLFLLVVAASLFAISHLLPLNRRLTTSPLSLPPPPSPSSSSSPLLSWFFLSPSSSNNSFNSTLPPLPPPLPPPPSQEEEKKEDDPLLANQGGEVSESIHGGYGDGGANSNSSTNGPLSGEKSEQGWGSTLPGNSTKNSTSAIATDRSGSDGEIVIIGKSFAPQSTSPNMTSTSCQGAQDQGVERNSTIKGVCFKGQIVEKKSGTSDEEKQKQQQQQQQHGERNRGGGRVSDAAAARRNGSVPSVAVKATGGGLSAAQCDIFNGRWVRDERNYPYYPPGSCPYLDDDFNCHKNGRPDSEFLKWRWQPYDCDIPRLNASDFLRRLRGKRLVFVGDSLNRNMWESLVCILRHSITNKKRVYEVSGRTQFKAKGRRRHIKTKGHYSFRFEDYECSVEFVRSTFLVREVQYKNVNGSEDEKLRLDMLDETTVAYREADVIVFNTGHWWTHEKTSRGIDYYQEGNHVYPMLKVMEAYKKALTAWSRWIDRNIDSRKTQVVFRGYSLTHFRGGQWNSGGQCHKEAEPIFNQSYLAKYPSKMRVLEQILKKMRTPVIYLNISRLTDYRKDGHPSIYRKKYASVEEQIAAEKLQDCSHWCLPGIPDSWNELLYASLLIAGKGSWRR